MFTHEYYDYFTIWREYIQNDFKKATEIFKGKFMIELDKKLDKSYFIEYMEDFKKQVLKGKK